MTTIPKNKRIAIIGGGTNTYISNHLALSAPAYGSTAKRLANKFKAHSENEMQVDLYLTKMAQQAPGNPDTPEEVEALVDRLVADPTTRVIIFNVAMVDYKPESLTQEVFNNPEYTYHEDVTTTFGKYAGRLSTTQYPELRLELTVQDKIIQKIRKERKDILLVGFKTTCGASKEEQYNKGLKLCKDASANIVFVNDVDKTRINKLQKVLDAIPVAKKMVASSDKTENVLGQMHTHNLNIQLQELQNNGLITPEESSYWYNTRDEALDALVQMVLDRSHLHFTRSTVVDSETVPWNTRDTHDKFGRFPLIPNPIIPETFRTVFDWVRSQGAYKQGPTGATVGHFGIALGPNEFLTSKRKTDFNKIEEVGLVRVITDDPDNVFGYKHFFENEEMRSIQNNLNLVKERAQKDQTDDDKMWTEVWTEFYKDKMASVKQNVIAFGAKPSVGGQSQRSLFDTFPDLNCIVHFHCPLKTEFRQEFNTTPQFSFECGSYECIKSNITGFKEYKVSEEHSIWAGHMDYHGPNIVFNSGIDPQLVIEFINKYWDLSRKTDGLTEENK